MDPSTHFMYEVLCLINSSPCGFFDSSRDQRQGDPLLRVGRGGFFDSQGFSRLRVGRGGILLGMCVFFEGVSQ